MQYRHAAYRDAQLREAIPDLTADEIRIERDETVTRSAARPRQEGAQEVVVDYQG